MKHIAYYILISLSIISCQRNYETSAILHTAESVMQDDPQQAKLLLESIVKEKLNNSALRAKYALLYSQALDKNYIDKTNDSLISIAIDYYNRKGTNQERALAHYYHGRIYENGNDVDNAIKSYVLADKFADHEKDCNLLALTNYSVGYLYSVQHSFPDALAKLHTATHYFRKSNAALNEANVLTQIARIHYLNNESDSASVNIAKAVEIYNSLGEESEAQKLYESIIAIQLDKNEKVDSLKKILQTCYLKTNSGKIPVTSMGLWQSIYMSENNLDSARICGRILLDNRSSFLNTKVAGCLAQMRHIEYLAGNYKKSCLYSLQYESLVDSIHNETQIHTIQELEQKYNNHLLKESNNNLLIRQKYQNIVIFLLVIILLFGSGLIFWTYQKWHQRVKYRMKLANAELGHLRATYSQLQSQYDAIKSKVDSNDEKEARLMGALNARLRGLCNLVETTQSTNSATFVKQFQNYVKVNVRSDISLSDLQYVVNKNYHGIIDYLEVNYPKLTKQDLDLCSLLCFGFSQYGICYIYGTEIQSFYNRRHRLRERLGLEKNQNIELFIKDLMRKLEQEQMN